jgi:hypothetical protein
MNSDAGYRVTEIEIRIFGIMLLAVIFPTETSVTLVE